MKKFYAVASLVLMMSFQPAVQVMAQSITVRGTVIERQTGEPLELATILLNSLSGPEYQRGTTTNRNGVYDISRLRPGEYLFRVSFVGYRSYFDTLRIAASEEDQVINKSVRLSADNENIGDLEVTGRRRDVNLEAGQQKIRKVELSRIPTPAGSGDLASYLRTLPGVVATGDRGGQFFVRGGTPAENLALIDGITIYRPFHILGFFSVFPEEIISDVDFYAGGFGPRYGSRTSSVLDVKLRNGDFEEHKVTASVSPFLSEVMAEGPLDKGRASYIVMNRGSLLEQSSRLHPEGTQPLRFNSQYFKMSRRNKRGANCTATGLRTYDRGRLDYDGEEVFQWSNFLLGGRCAIIPEVTNVSYFDVNLNLTRTNNMVGQAGVSERSSTITKVDLDLNYLAYFGKLEVEYGTGMDMRWMNFNISDMFQFLHPTKEEFITNDAYLKVNIPVGERMNIQPGFRTSVFWSDFKPTIEPRLQFSWKPRGNVNERLNAALGYYLQPVAGVADSRDAGTAFTAWMKVPDTNEQTKAIHALLGWRQPVGEYLDFTVEGYHKWLRNIPVPEWTVVAQFNTSLTLADGRSYGSDVTLKYNRSRFFMSLGYGYAYTEYRTTQELLVEWLGKAEHTYYPGHDRRHQVNVNAGVEAGNLTFNAGWSYGSGLPYSRPFGFDSHILLWEHIPDVKNHYGKPRILMDRPFNGRMPDFHSLNVSVEQAFFFSELRMNVQLGAINGYDRDNLFYYDIQNQRRINQLPLYPYLSLKVETL